jgi:hypothetical protein
MTCFFFISPSGDAKPSAGRFTFRRKAYYLLDFWKEVWHHRETNSAVMEEQKKERGESESI